MRRHKARINVKKAVTEVTRLVEKYNANEARYSRFCALMEAGMGSVIYADIAFKDRETIDAYFDTMVIIKKAEIARRVVESRGYLGEDDGCVDIQAI